MSLSTTLKSSIKKLLPEPVLDSWKRFRFEQEQRAAHGKPLEQVFSEIYETNAWAVPGDGARYSSGPGSAPAITQGYEDFVVGYLDRHPGVRTLVDIGCGDFQVGSRILSRLKRPVDYVGCDIAANVVAHNQMHHARAGVEFRHLDATRDALPAGDLVTVREVFQHLSNDAIHAALANLGRNYERAIVTEAQPAAPGIPNLDIVSGYRTRDGLNSGVYLELPPFGLTVLEEYALTRGNEVLRTTVVEL